MKTTVYTDSDGYVVVDCKSNGLIQYNGDEDMSNSLKDSVLLAVSVVLFGNSDMQSVGDKGLTKLFEVEHNDISNADLFKMIVDKVIVTL